MGPGRRRALALALMAVFAASAFAAVPASQQAAEVEAMDNMNGREGFSKMDTPHGRGLQQAHTTTAKRVPTPTKSAAGVSTVHAPAHGAAGGVPHPGTVAVASISRPITKPAPGAAHPAIPVRAPVAAKAAPGSTVSVASVHAPVKVPASKMGLPPKMLPPKPMPSSQQPSGFVSAAGVHNNGPQPGGRVKPSVARPLPQYAHPTPMYTYAQPPVPTPGGSPAAPKKPPTIADLIAAAAEALRGQQEARSVTGQHKAPQFNYTNFNATKAIDFANYTIKAITGCTLAQQLLGQCKAPPPPPARPPPPPRPPNPPPRPPSPPPPPPSYTYMEKAVMNSTCNSTMLLNGDFEKDKYLGATKLVGWAKLKENATTGGGGLYNGSAKAYTGKPGYPFDNPNRYFRTRQSGNIAFAMVNNVPINVTSKDQKLYFDWFVDNPWPYYFVVDTMSLLANHSEVVNHQIRIDLYDYDKLSPPGNFSDLAKMVFDQHSSTAGAAYLGPVLTPDIIAATPNLASMATEAPLAPYVGKRVLFVFRYSTNTYYFAFGLDNVQVVDCVKDNRRR